MTLVDSLKEHLGINRKPIITELGFATIRNRYDERGNLSEESYFDVSDAPTPDKDGVSKIQDI